MGNKTKALRSYRTENCINCGAPLNGDCEYCGTKYESTSVKELREASEHPLYIGGGYHINYGTGSLWKNIEQGLLQAAPFIIGGK